MSVSVVVEGRGVTVVTVATDPDSRLPAACQILRALCWRPEWCSANRALKASSTKRALGTVQIMVGLINIGLGPERVETYPYWLGVMFVAAGAVSLLADMLPTPCLAFAARLGNLLGAVMAVVAVVLYALHLANFSVAQMCDHGPRVRPDSNCPYVASLAQWLLNGLDINLIVLAVLQLCVSISLAVLGFRALCCKGRDKDVGDAEFYQPLVKEEFTSPGA